MLVRIGWAAASLVILLACNAALNSQVLHTKELDTKRPYLRLIGHGFSAGTLTAAR